MSKSKFDSDGFQIVSSKKSSKKNATIVPPRNVNFQKQDIEIDIERSYRRILTALDDIQTSDYLKNLIKAVSNVLKTANVIEITCFGLGHIGECNISQHQLALLLCLKNIFKPERVLVHDPIFYTNECKLLEKFSLNVIEQNTEGSYIIHKQDKTLVYLPHCPKQLTNNFLWSNWGLNLKNCILLCNSFTKLVENHPSRILNETVPLIHKIYPLTSEVYLDNIFIYKDIFNDTSLHYFTEEKLESVPQQFWITKGKPTYENSEEFITSLMIEKLTI